MIEKYLVRCMLWSHFGDSAGAKFEFGPAADPMRAVNSPREYLKLVDHSVWKAGEPTDDTDMAIAILSSYGEQKANHGMPLVDIDQNVLCRFFEWASRRPKDIGILTRRALSMSPYLGKEAGKFAWLYSNRSSAGNGGLMRCHPVAFLELDRQQVAEKAESICRLTHFDPRCVVTCIIQCLAIHDIAVSGTAPEAAFDNAVEHVNRMQGNGTVNPAYLAEEWSAATEEATAAVEVGREAAASVIAGQTATLPSSGYTIDGLCHASFAASAHGHLNGEQIIAYSIAHGQDADTNGAIAGAVVGAMEADEPACSASLLGAEAIRFHARRCFTIEEDGDENGDRVHW